MSSKPKLPKGAGPNFQDQKAPASKAELDILRQKITQLVVKNPDKAAVILADWINKFQKGKKVA